jgi:hypothetical protein
LGHFSPHPSPPPLPLPLPSTPLEELTDEINQSLFFVKDIEPLHFLSDLVHYCFTIFIILENSAVKARYHNANTANLLHEFYKPSLRQREGYRILSRFRGLGKAH